MGKRHTGQHEIPAGAQLPRLSAETAGADRELRRKIREVESWGFERRPSSAAQGESRSGDEEYASFYDEFIVPFQQGRLDLAKSAAFLRLVATNEGHPEIGRKHPDFPKLVLQTLEHGRRDWWTSISLKPVYRFTYPAQFHLILRHLEDAEQSFIVGCHPAALAISAISLLDESAKSRAKAILLQAARQLSLFDLVLLACLEHGWVHDLEQVLREGDRFEDVLKVLLIQNDWPGVLAWLQKHRRYADCARVLERLGRFQEAADLLQRLAPGTTGYSEKALAKEIARLTSLAGLAS
jgi:hypothetical protein